MIVTNKTLPLVKTAQMTQVLIVEDERMIALNLKENLESLGYSVVGIADSGETAIRQATEYSPDLVLMDICLKDEMDGIEAAGQIWERLAIPAIYVTGHSDTRTLERTKMTAPFGYILKPVTEQALHVTIETALQRYEREQMLTAILKSMGDGVIAVDREQRVQSLNRAAETLTGWSFSEARERELTEIFHLIDEQTQEPVIPPVATALQQEEAVYLDDKILLVSKTGTTVPIADSIAPIKDKQGAIVGVVLVFRDISDVYDKLRLRKEAESAIRQQLEREKTLNQLRTQLIQTASHEYRTPLAIILGCAQVLEDSACSLSPEKIHRNCQRIQHSVHYMARLLEDILTLNEMESGELIANPAPLDLQQFCRQIVEEQQLIDRDRHKLQFMYCGKYQSKDNEAWIDKKLLQQILGNLLANALKYSPTGSAVALFVSHDDNAIIFQVRDRGIGIPSDDQAYIFEPFHRAQNVKTISGTGMGLAIVKQAVDLHGGAIALESKIGVGTTFTITLPGDRR